jgi:hypothetical protein
MKATRPGPVVGYAVTGFDGTSGTVLVRVGAGYQAGDTVEQITNLENRISNLETDVTELKSQPGSIESVDLENLEVGSMTVELDLIIQGALVVDGPATFKEAVRFQKDATFDGNVAVNGTLMLNKDTAGFAKIKAGEQSIRIIFSKPYTDTPVITVSLGDGKFATYSYREVTAGGFEIILQNPASEDLTFTWTATAVNGAQTFVNAP